MTRTHARTHMEVHIKTTERTAMTYFVKPFMDQLARAFREQ